MVKERNEDQKRNEPRSLSAWLKMAHIKHSVTCRPRERGCQEIRRRPADLSFSSFPRKREPRDFSHLPPLHARGTLWAPAFAGATMEGATDLLTASKAGAQGCTERACFQLDFRFRR